MKTRLSKKFVCLVLLALSACAPIENTGSIPSVENLSLHGEANLTIHSEITLTKGVQSGFKRFRAKNLAYGAMFVGPNGTGFRSYSGLLSLEDALFTTEIGCRVETGRNCILFATIAPRDASGPTKLSRDFGDFLDSVKESQRPGQYVVIATDRVGNTATYYSEDLDYAKSQALQACAKQGDIHKGKSDRRIATAFAAAGVYECRVFGTYR